MTPAGADARAGARSHRASRAFARFLARAGRLALGAVPVRRRGVRAWQVVNLLARALWEIGLRWAPQQTLWRTRLASGAQAELDLSERIQAQAALTGAYEPALCGEIAAALGSDGTFVDVGGNVGLVTLEVLARAGPVRPRIHVFEPHPDNVAALERNLGLNPGARVDVVNAAVGNAEGSARLKTSALRGESGAHRIVTDQTGDGTIEVPVVTLDEYARRNGIERIDVLKIDVEGHEAAVLEGARELLGRQAVGMVILELNPSLIEEQGADSDDVYATLSRSGYRPSVLPSTSPTRLLRRLHHMAADDVAFRPGS
jgi:FkbM family methyltransferase